jgi:hypothetical protein
MSLERRNDWSDKPQPVIALGGTPVGWPPWLFAPVEVSPNPARHGWAPPGAEIG